MTALLHERIKLAVERRPEASAVVFGERRLSYRELDDLARRISSTLQEAGCRPGDRVCLMLPKEPETIAAMIGTLMAGCAYVPIDLASPAPRVARIVAASDPKVVLVGPTATRLSDGIAATGAIGESVNVGTLSSESAGPSFAFNGRDVANAPTGAPHVGEADSIAHILFTSGSTGEPKGVPVTHANVGAFLDWAIPTFEMSKHDRISSHPPLHFDLSTFDVFGSLTCGAELHLVDPRLNLSPLGLARMIDEAALTQWFSVPSTMTLLAKFDAVPDGGWRSLRRVLACGEVLPSPVLAHWMRRLPHASFANLYGPTEATIASSAYLVPEVPADETVPVPIGTACTGEELVVLDERLEPLPTGEVGELYIGGTGLTPGYWRDDARTALAFVADPRNPNARLYKTGDLARVDSGGLVHFLGRADSQVKTRGYRVELGEIEAALATIDLISESCIVGLPTEGFEGVLIGCVYAPADGRAVTPTAIRSRLAETLPSYMLPSRWLELSTLPKNANGKIDRVVVRRQLAESLDDERVERIS